MAFACANKLVKYKTLVRRRPVALAQDRTITIMLEFSEVKCVVTGMTCLRAQGAEGVPRPRHARLAAERVPRAVEALAVPVVGAAARGALRRTPTERKVGV